MKEDFMREYLPCPVIWKWGECLQELSSSPDKEDIAEEDQHLQPNNAISG